MLCCHVLELLPEAVAVGGQSQRHYLLVSLLLEREMVGVLLPELVLSLLLLQLEHQATVTRHVTPGSYHI